MNGYPMDPLSMLSVSAIASYIATRYFLHKESSSKMKACIDAYTISKPSWDTNEAFVKCMKTQFPDGFADSYKLKIVSESKLNDTE